MLANILGKQGMWKSIALTLCATVNEIVATMWSQCHARENGKIHLLITFVLTPQAKSILCILLS